jgi:hypothetical protein
MKALSSQSGSIKARQAWSLCARLLKAKYYPRMDLMDAVFSSDVSPTWRAVEHGLELLKKGVIWRVRSGAKNTDMAGSLDTTTTKWKKGRSRLWWVSQLMKEGRCEWDEGTLKSCMYQHDVEEVLKIRLSGQGWRGLLSMAP